MNACCMLTITLYAKMTLYITLTGPLCEYAFLKIKFVTDLHVNF